MKFEEVKADIKKLVGKKIRSIRPGADVTLTEVCLRDDRLELIDSSGNNRSRPLLELRRIWDQLCAHKVIHVDSVLAGSGSSRNQPETILANLPYVEWLMIKGRKHITFVGSNTHPLGTLKEMDAMAAHILRESLNSARRSDPAMLLVVDNVKSISSFLESVSGLAPEAVAPGVYRQVLPDSEIWIAAHDSITPSLPVASYIMLTSKEPPLSSTLISVAGKDLYAIERNGVRFLIQVN